MSEATNLSETADPIVLTSEIVAAYVSYNALNPVDLVKLIAEVHASLLALKSGPVEPAPEERPPAVPIKKSVTPDHIVCLEDGLKFKSLKRHLRTNHGMTPEQYREKWGLPTDYPIVSPNYSATRSQLAKSSGLGLSRTSTPQPRSRHTKAGT